MASTETIEGIKRMLEDAEEGATEKEYISHVEAALESRSTGPVTVPRTLEQCRVRLGSARYLDNLGPLTRLVKFNCHIGQRKLALALIEFMNISARVHASTKLFVVYPGSSIMACLAAAEFYPEARFLCFDPAFDATVTNVRRELRKDADTRMRDVHVIRADTAETEPAVVAFTAGATIVVYTDSAGMYGDQTHEIARSVRAAVDPDEHMHTIMCSDVRMDTVDGEGPSEAQIAEEMVSQAVWVARLDVKCFVLKFRMPFLDETADIDTALKDRYESMYESLGVKRPKSTGPDVTLPYLSGDTYIQLYARPTSAELRLVGTDGVKLQRYSLRQIEETMAAFNVVHRGHTCFTFPEGKTVPEKFLTAIRTRLAPREMGCMSYDALCEAGILYEACAASGSPCDVGVLEKKMATFSKLYASGRHPQTCAVSGTVHKKARKPKRAVRTGKKPKRTGRTEKREVPSGRRHNPFTPAYIGGSRRNTGVVPMLALCMTTLFATVAPYFAR